MRASGSILMLWRSAQHRIEMVATRTTSTVPIAACAFRVKCLGRTIEMTIQFVRVWCNQKPRSGEAGQLILSEATVTARDLGKPVVGHSRFISGRTRFDSATRNPLSAQRRKYAENFNRP